MTDREQVTTAEGQSKERERFWREFREGYERLAADEEAWADIEAERAVEEGSLKDGLPDD